MKCSLDCQPMHHVQKRECVILNRGKTIHISETLANESKESQTVNILEHIIYRHQSPLLEYISIWSNLRKSNIFCQLP
jgi:hypothetical protein